MSLRKFCKCILREIYNDASPITVISPKTKEQMQGQIEMQLHQQFAENYNSTFGSIITLFVFMLGAISCYGLAFVNTNLEFSSAMQTLRIGSDYFIDILIFAAIVALVMLTIVKYLCLYLGYNQRMEQFITFAIRCKYYGQDPTTLPYILYPEKYHPFNKEKNNDNDFIIGIYGKLIPIICWMQWGILIGVAYKTIYSTAVHALLVCKCTAYRENLLYTGIFELLALIVVGICCYGWYNSKKSKFWENYIERQAEYRPLHPKTEKP